MNGAVVGLSAAAVAAAYLIGAIPFGFLLAKWLRGVDIRTVGSGNIGATNVGRFMGFRFFVVVFLFDAAKGLLPTLYLPKLVAWLTGQPAPPELAVLAGMASILGHNFPVYLGFKGGKGVATSLGAVFALDPWSGLAAAGGFAAAMAVCRFVSLSSLIGGGVFVVTHFARARSPWSREQMAMSVATVGLLAMLLFRHRKNLGRIAAGTEPKVTFRKPRGVIASRAVIALAAGSAALAGAVAWLGSDRSETLTVGAYTLREVSRVGTGQQRAERLAFADEGKLLAVTCPRYGQIALFRVSPTETLDALRNLPLEGQPVAIAASADRLYVLQRPAGDRRHVEPGWWETFDLKGDPVGARVPVGMYPDDLALTTDGRHAVVLTSGKGEGDPDKAGPALGIYDLANSARLGTVALDGKADDPARLTLSANGRAAVVTLPAKGECVAFDLTEPAKPREIGRSPLAKLDQPYPSRTGDDWILMPVASAGEGVVLPFAGLGECVVCTLPKGSGLEIYQPTRRESLGRLALHSGSLGLSKTRPTGLAYDAGRGLIAVANRSGSVHLVTVRTTPAVASAPAKSPESRRKF